jgi:biotin operon repressor
MKKIIDIIPVGKENSISKWLIASKLRIAERDVRKHIEELRKRGHCIAVDTANGGYYIPKDIMEAKDYLAMESSRAITVIHNTKNLIKIFNANYKKLNYELQLQEEKQNAKSN